RRQEGRESHVRQGRRQPLRIAAGRAGRREGRFDRLHGSEQIARRAGEIATFVVRGSTFVVPSRFVVLVVLLAAPAVSACAPRVRVTQAPPSEATSLTGLRHSIDSILADPALAHGYWGVLVKSLKNDETLYAVNASKLFVPASNMKIVTLAAAAERLGWDY